MNEKQDQLKKLLSDLFYHPIYHEHGKPIHHKLLEKDSELWEKIWKAINEK